MIAKTKNAVAALAAFASGTLTHQAPTALVLAGPGYHVALSQRRRLRLLQRRQPGVRLYAPAQAN